ncbi:Myocardin-related transcription factor B [Camelus dromedarius]|uniref:Myocardin-related transcription factor B n=1 Tax=Camelus dromedarius TaxID=9838 RepID=A0A5N4CW96_CAMDR|nr:Myocardin-related transcription factor B [Camelus dromedarius]
MSVTYMTRKPFEYCALFDHFYLFPFCLFHQFTSVSPAVPEFLKTPTTDQPPTRSTAPILPTNTVSSAKPGPTLVKQSHPKNPNDKHRSKKCKDPKPRVKKLKYHQYIPPDQKGEKNEPQMDSNYARLLQQQQLFLQLQILSQQQQHYNYQTILPAPLKPLNEKNSNSGNPALNNTTPNTARQNTSAPVRKPGPLPSSLDDLKVSELKTELKLRGLPVSGTKPDLIERLKPYQEMNSSGVAAGGIVAVSTSAIVTSSPEVAMALPVTALHSSVTSSGPAFKAELPSAGAGGVAHVENVSSPLPISPSPSEQSSLSAEDTSVADTFTEIMTMMSPSQFLCSSPLRATSNEDSLSPTSSTLSNLELDAAEKDRKLQEKEKQIEELKRKLEQEQKLVEVLKMQLEVEKRGQQQQQQRPWSPPPGRQHLRAAGWTRPAAAPPPRPQPVGHIQPRLLLCSRTEPGSPPPPQPFVVQHSLFGSPVPKTKDPPRYEEAIKQTRSTQSALPEISNAHSQQMDDLFDILIKSGEISLPIKEEPSPISKMRPVTASITTMPVSTVVSRPPPQVQMAPPISLEPMSSLSTSLENQLEAFLDGTLPSASEITPLQSSSEDREPFSLIEDLQNDLLSHPGVLDHSHSPMETTEAQFAASTPCLSLDLSDSNLDNMEWLDITMPSTSSGLTPLSATAPGMFSADFLDPQDLPLPWD